MVAFQIANVVARAGHFPCVDWSVGAEPGDEASGSINAAALFNGFVDKCEVRPGEIVERRAAPVALRFRRLLHEGEHAVALIHFSHAAFAQPCRVRLAVAHNAGGALLLPVAKEVFQAERQQVVSRHHKQLIVDSPGLNAKGYVHHRAEPGLVGLGTVVHEGYLIAQRVSRDPLPEYGCELVVGDHHVSVHQAGALDVPIIPEFAIIRRISALPAGSVIFLIIWARLCFSPAVIRNRVILSAG